MLSTVATIVTICNGIFTFIKGLLGGGAVPKDENTQAVETANKADKIEGQVSRDTAASIMNQREETNAKTDADVAAVRRADSLQSGAQTLQAAVDGANSHIGSNG